MESQTRSIPRSHQHPVGEEICPKCIPLVGCFGPVRTGCQGTALGKMTVRDYMTFEGSPVVIVNKFLPDRRLQVAWNESMELGSVKLAQLELGWFF